MTGTVLAAPVRTLSAGQPLNWLARGWRDFARTPGASLLHGLVFLVAGGLIASIGWGRNDLLVGAFSGFLLMAPTLCAGVYELSRRLFRGERGTLRDALVVWVRGTGPMVRLGLLLAVLGSLWVLLSVLIVSVVQPEADGGGGGVGEFMFDFILSPDPWPFVLWALVGGVFAALVFAVSVVSMPMLLDRETSLSAALLTSASAVGANPVPMAVWATLVMLITLVGLVTIFPLVVLVPWLGHATWHAYVDTVDASALPPRP